MAVAFVLLLSIFLGISRLVIARYEPLGFYGGGIGPFGPRAVSHELPPFVSGSAYSVDFVPGEEFGVLFDLTNFGPWGVTVTDFPLEDFAYHEVAAIQMEAASYRAGPRPPIVPFKPFALGPRESRTIRIVLRFRDCDKTETKDGIWNGVLRWIPVKYRVAGVTEEADFRLPVTFAYQAHGESCWLD